MQMTLFPLTLFKEIRKKIAGRNLSSLLDGKERSPVLCTVSQAKRIGILFELEAANRINTLLKEAVFQNKQVELLAFDPLRPRKDRLLPDHAFSIRDTNWFGRPDHQAIRRFLDREYDMLIDLTIADHFPMLFVAALTEARLKLSLHSETKKRIADIMISMPPGADPLDLFRQMQHYLDQLNKPI